MKKIITLLLASMMVVSLFAGCGKTEEKPSEKQAPKPEEKKEEHVPQVNEYGWEVPEKTLEINYYAGKGNADKVEQRTAMMKEYILEKFNVKLNKIVSDQDTNERLNLMLASNDYPEMISGMSADNLQKWAELGKLVDVAPIVEKVGVNYKKEMGSNFNRYKDEEGRVFGLPIGWGYAPTPDKSAHIRWDWYTAMGKPAIETPEDYYNVLKEMVAAHPQNAKGEKVYALSWSERTKIEIIAGFWGLKDGYKEDSNNNLTHWLNTDEGLEFTKFYNKVYRDGLFDPDAFINTYDDWKMKFSNERIVGHMGYWWVSWNAGHEVWQKQNENWTDDQRYVQIAFKAPEAEKAYLSPKDTMGWNYTVITDKAEDPESLVKFLDFQVNPIGTRLFAFGIPNLEISNWNYNADGTWEFTDSTRDGIVNGTFDYEQHYSIGANRYWLAYQHGLLSDDMKTRPWIDQNFNHLAKWKKLLNENMKDTIYDNTARRVVFTPDNPLTIVKQRLDDSVKSGWAKAVLSETEEECIANFNELRDNMNKAGLKDLEKFLTDEYKQNLENWK